jgi:hypothetical protein
MRYNYRRREEAPFGAIMKRPMTVSIWFNPDKGVYDIYSHSLKKVVSWALTMEQAKKQAQSLYDIVDV